MSQETLTKTLTTAQTSESGNSLLKGVIESFFDGILILTEQQEWIYANDYARKVCEQLQESQPVAKNVPLDIWHVCQSLIEHRDWYAHQPVMIESEITIGELSELRVRARWLKLDTLAESVLLVILEDPGQSTQSIALAEVEQYHLTPREADVWLLRRANYTCKEIASELVISINTVKKHLKNITMKKRMFSQNLN